MNKRKKKKKKKKRFFNCQNIIEINGQNKRKKNAVEFKPQEAVRQTGRGQWKQK
jgi:hypothetical protein